ncbi:hypothetical protein [Fimbriiglobus ruber]|uniref:hypothetical protein n=1 Tax=Fimbriiglobus ruber TaxID=1908690 RepID=UPI000B4BD7DB|nr:hypothetical protein [Fimbriiglobus ruber]
MPTIASQISRLLQSRDYAALRRSAPNGVVSDWLQDHGEFHASAEVGVATPWRWLDIWRFLGGRGYGDGYGDGYGYGYGENKQQW